MDVSGIARATLLCGIGWFVLFWYGHERGYAPAPWGIMPRVPAVLTRFFRRTPGPLLTWSLVNQLWGLYLTVVAVAVLIGAVPASAQREVISWAWYAGLSIGLVWAVLALAAAVRSRREK